MNKKLNELRGMGVSERMLKMQELRNDLAREKAFKSTNTRPENPGKAKNLRKQIARILTFNKMDEMKKETMKETVKEVKTTMKNQKTKGVMA